jgi:hypothetical protein
MGRLKEWSSRRPQNGEDDKELDQRKGASDRISPRPVALSILVIWRQFRQVLLNPGGVLSWRGPD